MYSAQCTLAWYSRDSLSRFTVRICHFQSLQDLGMLPLPTRTWPAVLHTVIDAVRGNGLVLAKRADPLDLTSAADLYL